MASLPTSGPLFSRLLLAKWKCPIGQYQYIFNMSWESMQEDTQDLTPKHLKNHNPIKITNGGCLSLNKLGHLGRENFHIFQRSRCKG